MRITVIICVIWFSAAWAVGEVIVLKDGSKITAQVLAEKDKQVVVDLGYTVISIPREEIVEYKAAEDAQAAAVLVSADANGQTLVNTLVDQTKLYRTGTCIKTSLEECVDRFSEAVVMVSTPAGLGSGFFINDQGYLITNYHVIEQETKIEITVFQKQMTGFEKKKFKKVRIEALNPFIDLALLKIEDLDGYKTKYCNLGDLDSMRVGETVFAIGNPMGLERTTTSGIVSLKNRGFEGLVYIQTNADINPGNSGGPLFNLAGEVVGVTNMGYIFMGGLGFAIPIDYVKHFISNREAFAYDKDNANTGFRYVQPAGRANKAKPVIAIR
ncbi:MAG: hypothetical protein A2Y12_04645 [Planctomycetes bacterium GWF2_42_9]|nr:MAG: hypothetical protein A2Y12_04645 [Planctomycetes bacterium GWF2_42_9]